LPFCHPWIYQMGHTSTVFVDDCPSAIKMTLPTKMSLATSAPVR